MAVKVLQLYFQWTQLCTEHKHQPPFIECLLGAKKFNQQFILQTLKQDHVPDAVLSTLQILIQVTTTMRYEPVPFSFYR